MAYRVERDPLGELNVPADAYYGVQTARAVENFPISCLRAPADLVVATIVIKKAAAEANAALGRLERDVAIAIVQAAAEILGEPRGSYKRVHPNDHVNMGQSTNDVFPTATRLALLLGSAPLVAEGRALVESLARKADEFAHVLK